MTATQTLGWQPATRSSSLWSAWRYPPKARALLIGIEVQCPTCWGAGHIYERLEGVLYKCSCAHCGGDGKRLVLI